MSERLRASAFRRGEEHRSVNNETCFFVFFENFRFRCLNAQQGPAGFHFVVYEVAGIIANRHAAADWTCPAERDVLGTDRYDTLAGEFTAVGDVEAVAAEKFDHRFFSIAAENSPGKEVHDADK